MKYPENVSTEDDDNGSGVLEYDIIIVGAGPSCIGFLYGLLSSFDQQSTLPKFTIALIERGGDGDGQNNNISSSSNTFSPQTEAYNTNKHSPEQWFQSSHPILTKESAFAKLYDSAPQSGLQNRIIKIPTGKGLGGGSNINACLVVRPSEDDFNSWPLEWQTSKKNLLDSSLSDDGTKKCRSKIMAGVLEVENIMRQNGALTVLNPTIQLKDGQRSSTFSDGESKEDPRNTRGLKSQTSKEDSNNVFTTMNSSSENLPTIARVTCASKISTHSGSKRAIQSYERVDYFQAILAPLLRRNPKWCNTVLTFLPCVQVERIIVQNTSSVQKSDQNCNWEAKGVECSKAKIGKNEKSLEYFDIYARKRVVLCAGAILSPALLLISGIGPASELKANGIDPLTAEHNYESSKGDPNWTAVGKQLRDHLILVKGFLIPSDFFANQKSCSGIQGFIAVDATEDNCNESKSQNGTCSGNSSVARCFLALGDGSASPWIFPGLATLLLRENQGRFRNLSRYCVYFIWILMTFFLQWTPLKHVLQKYTSQILICLLNPASTGNITIRKHDKEYGSQNSRLSDYQIVIDSGYLTDESDVERFILGWKVVNKISSRLYSNCIELLPGPFFQNLDSPKGMRRFAENFAAPFFHWSGSCAMVNSDETNEFVVHSDLRVRGFCNLYVCDASVFPGNISGPTALTCAGLGYACSKSPKWKCFS